MIYCILVPLIFCPLFLNHSLICVFMPSFFYCELGTLDACRIFFHHFFIICIVKNKIFSHLILYLLDLRHWGTTVVSGSKYSFPPFSTLICELGPVFTCN